MSPFAPRTKRVRRAITAECRNDKVAEQRELSGDALNIQQNQAACATTLKTRLFRDLRGSEFTKPHAIESNGDRDRSRLAHSTAKVWRSRSLNLAAKSASTRSPLPRINVKIPVNFVKHRL